MKFGWIVLVAVCLGCGGDSPSTGATPDSNKKVETPTVKPTPAVPDKPATEGNGGGDAVTEPEGKPVDPATAGGISGTVTFKGEAPKRGVHDISGDAKCSGMHDKPLRKEDTIIKDGKIENVLIYVKAAPEGIKFDPPTETPVIDQTKCQYSPHVVVVVKGQDLEIRNSDDLLHNINGNAFKKNKGFNFGQDGAGKVNKVKFNLSEIGVLVKCDVHSWMGAVVHVVPNSKFAKTGSDGGFKIDGLPPGDYEIVAWHETLGEQSKKIRVDEQATATADFEFEKK